MKKRGNSKEKNIHHTVIAVQPSNYCSQRSKKSNTGSKDHRSVYVAFFNRAADQAQA
jgi:hypothetical protein